MADPLTASFWDEEAALLSDLVWELVEQATPTAVTQALAILQAMLGSGIDVNYDLLNDTALEQARRYTFDLVTGLTNTSQAALQNAFSDWIISGEPLDVLVESLLPMWGANRAAMIAITETTRIYADANLLAWRESGVVAGKKWNTAIDDTVCPICQPLQGAIAQLGDDFTDGIFAPPAHVRCRCWIQPVLVEGLVNA